MIASKREGHANYSLARAASQWEKVSVRDKKGSCLFSSLLPYSIQFFSFSSISFSTIERYLILQIILISTHSFR